MKKLFVPFLFCALLFGSCDKVEFPIEPPEVVTSVDSITFPEIDSAGVHVTSKRLLVEEFTGHQCTACPTSTEELLDQQANAGDEIIVVSMHAGVFAPVKMPDYPTEFRTPIGNKLDTLYVSGFGYPSVLINRQKNAGNNVAVYTSFQQWETPINNALNQSTDVGLALEADYIPDSNAFAISVALKAVNNLTGQYRLVLLCVEDSVIAEQKDSRLDEDEYPHKINTQYVHRHVVRGQLNSASGIFGDVVISSTLAAGSWTGKQYYYQVPAMVGDPEKCSIVAYIIDAATEEIMQSEEVHVHTVQ